MLRFVSIRKLAKLTDRHDLRQRENSPNIEQVSSNKGSRTLFGPLLLGGSPMGGRSPGLGSPGFGGGGGSFTGDFRRRGGGLTGGFLGSFGGSFLSALLFSPCILNSSQKAQSGRTASQIGVPRAEGAKARSKKPKKIRKLWRLGARNFRIRDLQLF
jgi:hypothetical protein